LNQRTVQEKVEPCRDRPCSLACSLACLLACCLLACLLTCSCSFPIGFCVCCPLLVAQTFADARCAAG
jgi:hypothetical protein